MFWDVVDAALGTLGVSAGETYLGLEFFRFWDGDPR